MEGIYQKLLWEWSGSIEHENHGRQDKILRYQIGARRYLFLKANAQPFAVRSLETGEQQAALLVELEGGDRAIDMPEWVNFEYICGAATADDRYIMFAYIWFATIQDAKDYVQRHQMRVLGGW